MWTRVENVPHGAPPVSSVAMFTLYTDIIVLYRTMTLI